MNKKQYPIEKTEEQWLKVLGEEKYHILRQKGTERPNSGEFNLHFNSGNYYCAACNALLFDSNTKFDSGCGWPSFDQAVEGSIEYQKDNSHGMLRTEILCAQCGSHMGHVFNDGPTKTGQRYCVNSLSLKFSEKT